jgi:MerR family copper efflux transcriptional regulator
MKIGELATQVGISRDAIRFYEKMGLIHSKRLSNGYRVYDHTAKDQIIFIKSAQDHGLSLADIQNILPIVFGDALTTDAVQEFVTERVSMIDERIASLQVFKDRLVALPINKLECPVKLAYGCIKEHIGRD